MSKQILVPLDSSPVSREVIHLADQWAHLFDAKLTFLQVNPVQKDVSDQEILESILQQEEITSEFRAMTSYGNPAQEILEHERLVQPWLIMMAAHSHSVMSRILLGSNTDYVTNLSKSSVYVYKRSLEAMNDVILVPIDYSRSSAEVIRWADDIAQKMDLSLHFMHVYSLPEFAHYNMEQGWDWDAVESTRAKVEEEEALKAYLNKQEIISPFSHELALGKPYEQILARQRLLNARLICVGSHTHNLLERILTGSNTKYLLHHTNSSMLVYKG